MYKYCIYPLVAVWSGSALFACAILSEKLVYRIFGQLPYSDDTEKALIKELGSTVHVIGTFVLMTQQTV